MAIYWRAEKRAFVICSHCHDHPNGGGAGDFNNMCCRLRFLRTLPTNAMRMEWLKRWRGQGYPAQDTLNEYKRGLHETTST